MGEKSKVATRNIRRDANEDIKKLLKELKITTVMVTHDSYEAFYMGDKCGIILDKR